jgi:hypothetical protein
MYLEQGTSLAAELGLKHAPRSGVAIREPHHDASAR